MKKDERSRIREYISSQEGSLTAADVAGSTGLAIGPVAAELERVAEETGGVVRVLESGEVTYDFSSPRSNAALSEQLSGDLGRRLAAIAKVSAGAIRKVFGALFFTSMTIVFTLVGLITMAVVFIVALFSRDPSLSEEALLEYLADLPNAARLQPGLRSVGRRDPERASGLNRKPKGNLLDESSSFLLGDGAPDARIQEREKQLIGELITANRGVLIEDQLLPYMMQAEVDDQTMLDILKRFDGRPEVADSGTVIYVFPSFAGQPAAKKTALSDYLEEDRWRFSSGQPGATTNMAILSTLTCLGSYWLRRIFLAFLPITELLLVVNIILVYSLLYLCVPVFRYILIAIRNRRIARRNNRRRKLSYRLKEPPPELAKALDEASRYRSSLPALTDQEVVYETEHDLLEQSFRGVMPEKPSGVLQG